MRLYSYAYTGQQSNSNIVFCIHVLTCVKQIGNCKYVASSSFVLDHPAVFLRTMISIMTFETFGWVRLSFELKQTSFLDTYMLACLNGYSSVCLPIAI